MNELVLISHELALNGIRVKTAVFLPVWTIAYTEPATMQDQAKTTVSVRLRVMS
jgi:hypothetical protein